MRPAIKSEFPIRARGFVPVYCALLTALLVLVCWVRNNTVFLYDSADYWTLGSSFWDPSFSFANYPETLHGIANIRGYLLPFILGAGARISSALFGTPYLLYWVTYSFCVVVLVAYILPSLVQINFFSYRYVIGTLAGVVLVVYFWRDLLIYPLSDFPSLAAYAGAVFLIYRLSVSQVSGIAAFFMGLAAGALSYAAYNIRTVYLYPLLLLWALFLLYNIYKKRLTLLYILIPAVMGAAVIAVPQCIVNMNTYGSYTPVVMTVYQGQGNLFVAQLLMGEKYSRYETYIGDANIFPSPGVHFINETGEALSAGQEQSSVLAFLVWAVTNFLDACAIYTEHLISGITIFWNNTYLSKIAIDTEAYLLNCCIYILALVGAVAVVSEKKISAAKEAVPVVFILLPCFMAAFGAVEVRYLLAIYLLVYLFITLKLDYKQVFAYICTHKLFVCLLVVAVFLCWNMTASHLLASIEYGMLTLGGNYYPG